MNGSRTGVVFVYPRLICPDPSGGRDGGGGGGGGGFVLGDIRSIRYFDERTDSVTSYVIRRYQPRAIGSGGAADGGASVNLERINSILIAPPPHLSKQSSQPAGCTGSGSDSGRGLMVWCADDYGLRRFDTDTCVESIAIVPSGSEEVYALCWDRTGTGTPTVKQPYSALYYSTRDRTTDEVALVWLDTITLDSKRYPIECRTGYGRIDKIECTPAGHILLSQSIDGSIDPARFFVFDPNTGEMERLEGVDGSGLFGVIHSARLIVTVRTGVTSGTRYIETATLSSQYFPLNTDTDA